MGVPPAGDIHQMALARSVPPKGAVMRAAAYVIRRHPGIPAAVGGSVVALGGGLAAVGLVPHHRGVSPADSWWLRSGLLVALLGIAISVAVFVVLIRGRMNDEKWRMRLAAHASAVRAYLEDLSTGKPILEKEIADWYTTTRDDLWHRDVTGALLARFETGPLQPMNVTEPTARRNGWVSFLHPRADCLRDFLRELRD
jgi:hypothetical protein